VSAVGWFFLAAVAGGIVMTIDASIGDDWWGW